MCLKHLLVFILMIASAACTNPSNGGKGAIEGTSDTGGGNGLENKAYEAYIVNVDQLPSYKALVEPKVKKLLAMAPKGYLVTGGKRSTSIVDFQRRLFKFLLH